jgi:hypothetical protein
MATKRSVVLKGCPTVSEEGVATEAIKPGYLVKGVSSVSKQTGTTGSVPKAVALERDELGQGIDNTYQGSGTESASYASGDRVKVGVFKSGEESTGYVASGQNISEDDLLQSAGDGTFAEGSTKPIARAMETLGAVTVETKLRVQYL